jgi:flagellar biosynthesis protein FlhA
MRQVALQPRALATAAGILVLLGLVPGLPGFPLLTLAVLSGTAAYFLRHAQPAALEEAASQEAQQATTSEPPPDPMEPLTPIDLLELEVGYGLITLVDGERNGELLERIKTVRRQIAQDLGVVVPPLRIRDNLQLKPGEYTMLIKGVEVARGDLMLGHYLAMYTGEEAQPDVGIPTTEPAFGLPAVWVSAEAKDQVQLAGYTVVDLPTVIITHLTEVIKRHLHELLSREEVQKLLKHFGQDYPKVVEELVPTLLSLGGIQKVLQNLLREQISIRDLLTILETLADYAPLTRDPVTLTEYVRQSLARSITRQWQTPEGDIPAILLSYEVEDTLTKAIQHTEHGSYLAIDPKFAQRLINELTQAVEAMVQAQYTPLLVTSPLTRPHVKRLTEPYLPQFIVLSHNDIVANVRIRNLGVVKV